MFEKLLRFFVNNSRLNYLLFILVFFTGVWLYTKTPKEIFPSFDLDIVTVNGHYAGASIDMLDKMAVREIERELKNIDGITKMATVISAGKFNIILELDKRVDKYNTAEKVKNSIALIKRYLPSDMNEPVVNVREIRRDLMRVAISSQKLPRSALIEAAGELKERVSLLKNISEVKIFGDSDRYYDIRLDTRKIRAYGLDERSVVAALGGLSYIFPIGMVEERGASHFYLSTFNGPKDAQEMLRSRLKIGEKSLYLGDIATVSKRYEDAATLYSIDGKNAVDVSIKQSDKGNALVLADRIREIVAEMNRNGDGLYFTIHNDRSEKIRDRLGIVTSNILLGLILIALLVGILINWRMSLVITLGIPTSFVIGVIYLYLSGYTINMISLVGVLIALGIIVDDAIVVSEIILIVYPLR